MDVVEWFLAIAVIVAVVVWLRAGRNDGDGTGEPEPFEHPAGPDTVFCELCRDWHPPGNHAGEW